MLKHHVEWYCIIFQDEDVYTLPYFDTRPESEREAKRLQKDRTDIKFELKAENYFSCTVGRECSQAQYKLKGTSDVVSLLHDLAKSLPPKHSGT
jgi:hypothetical protein